MKEKYYTSETIDSKSKEFLAEIEYLRQRHEYELRPNECALLIIDMQDYFIDEKSHAYVPSAEAIVPRIKKLQDVFLEHNRIVVQTKHINRHEDAGMMNQWWSELVTQENPLSNIDERLADNSTIPLRKPQYDAFLNTNLELTLKEYGITQVVICGLMTHLCCESSARSAFMRGFEVLFTIDGTATYREDFHRAAILNLAHGFAHPVLTGEIIKGLENR